MSAAPQVSDVLKFDIEIVKGPHAGQKYNFEKSSISIGRGTENDIILDKDPRVSRQHVEIKQSLGEFYVVNLSQRNFVMINGQTITSEKLESETLIQVGDCELKFTAISPVVEEKESVPDPVVKISLPAAKPNPAGVVVPPMVNLPPTIPAKSPVIGVSSPQGFPSSLPPSHQQSAAQNPFMGTRARPPSKNSNTGYIVIGVVILMLLLLFNSSKKKKIKQEELFRSSERIQQDIMESDSNLELLNERKTKLDNIQYKRAQENFIKAFRDFRDGQYGRAKDGFQVVLNLDPDNELAKRYYNLARVKFDEQVKFSILQGHRYREKNNFKLCMSNFLNVMNMLQNNRNDPSFMEAEKFYKECQLNVMGRF